MVYNPLIRSHHMGMIQEWFAQTLVDWVRENARPFAWDDAFAPPRDPYRILVSELMLTRTNAIAAEVVYRKFIDRFPTLSSINGSDAEVVRIFEGLGLHRRASRMPELFSQLHELGEVPQTYRELISLHGVGPYVANAVLCFAFGESVVPVDVNVVRVVSRFFTVDHAGKEFQSFVNGLLNPSVDPRAFALSLMELGAQVCRVKKPLCRECPISERCSHSLLS